MNSFIPFISGSTALFVGPWPLLQSVGLLGRVISPSQGRYLHTGLHKSRKNAHTDIHALNGIRTHDPSFRASGDSSVLRPWGHCDRPYLMDTRVNFKGGKAAGA
jgi:hypothetical protein